MASKVYLLPISQLSFEELRKAFKKAKQDARGNKAASNVEGGKQDVSNPTA
jgi:hypothetical protein